MTRLAFILSIAATPAFAAGEKGFFSLSNTDFVVWISFLLFVGVLIYFKVPQMIAGQLDNRAASIRSELDDAKALREEAQTLLASYERKQREVQDQADRIVAQAKRSAEEHAESAKADLANQIERRVAAAEDQIASAESAAIAQVRNEAVRIAVAAAGEVVASQMTGDRADALIDESIETVRQKLH